MKFNSNTLFIILTACIVAGGAYWYFFIDSGNQLPLTSSTSENQAQTQFQTLVSELQPISFDTSIFSDPRFFSLRDLTTPIFPEPAGRADPFAPISGVRAQ